MLSPLNRRSVTNEVFEQIADMIKSGSYHVGARLPSEKELCAKLGVGRSSAREALQKLQALGFVEIRRGSGVYVLSDTGIDPNSGYSKWFEANKHKIVEIWELRTAIECAATALAAERATIEEAAALGRAEASFEATVALGDPHQTAQADEDFHYAVLRAAHNSALVAVYDLIREPLLHYRQQTFSIPGAPPRAVEPHRMIVWAIQEHLPGVAREAMQAHLVESRTGAERAAKEASERE